MVLAGENILKSLHQFYFLMNTIESMILLEQKPNPKVVAILLQKDPHESKPIKSQMKSYFSD